LVTTTSAGICAALMRSQANSAPTGTLPLAPTTSSAESAAASACTTSPAKSGKPGVSSRLMRTPFQSQWATEVVMLMERRCSSGSKSRMEVPWSVEPSRAVAPATWRSASHSVVLPSWLCPSTATERMRSGVGDDIRDSSPPGHFGRERTW
jgi:hypothetical protein